jgi:hypothetical protein
VLPVLAKAGRPRTGGPASPIPNKAAGPSHSTHRYARAPLPAALAAEETDACFIVRDHNRQALAYVYFEEYAAQAAKLLTPRSAHRRQHRQAIATVQ